jgi:uncharacterized membrane protein YjjP (DUF1212 family)
VTGQRRVVQHSGGQVPAVERTTPAAEERRRAVLVAVRLGLAMLASGASANEVETTLYDVLCALGLPEASVVASYSAITVSLVLPGEIDAMTVVENVPRQWADYNRLSAAVTLAADVRRGAVDLFAAEGRLDELASLGYPYPAWLTFAAPALLSMAVTIMFGGRLQDALATLVIGLAIQPALQHIERSDLSAFFQVAVGVVTTTALVVLLVKIGLPISGGLVLTGSLLRFLPGGALVSGMTDFIEGSLAAGAVRLVEVVLLGAAIAGSASLVLAFGESIDVTIRITSEGVVDWSPPVLIGAGIAAVVFYGCRLGVPRRAIWSAALLGGLAVAVTRGFTGVTADLDQQARTLLAALVIGAVGRLLAHRTQAPAALWIVTAVLPLLPAPSTLLPLLAESEVVRDALRGQAVQTAFSIGVGAAVGSIVVDTYLRNRTRVLHPIAGVVSATLHPVAATRWRRRANPRKADDRESHE